MLSILIKHLDHRNIVKQPILQINIVKTILQLVDNVEQKASAAIVSAISDLIKQLRKCLQNLAEASDIGSDEYKLNIELRSALEMCISQFSNKVCITFLFLNKLSEEKTKKKVLLLI